MQDIIFTKTKKSGKDISKISEYISGHQSVNYKPLSIPVFSDLNSSIKDSAMTQESSTDPGMKDHDHSFLQS